MSDSELTLRERSLIYDIFEIPRRCALSDELLRACPEK